MTRRLKRVGVAKVARNEGGRLLRRDAKERVQFRARIAFVILYAIYYGTVRGEKNQPRVDDGSERRKTVSPAQVADLVEQVAAVFDEEVKKACDRRRIIHCLPKIVARYCNPRCSGQQ